MVQTAVKLQASRLVTGRSAKMSADELAQRIGEAWERLRPPRPPLSLEIFYPGEETRYFNLGPHPPRLWPEDVDLVHDVWLKLARDGFGSKLHHRDVVGVALRRLKRELESDKKNEVLEDFKNEIRKN